MLLFEEPQRQHNCLTRRLRNYAKSKGKCNYSHSVVNSWLQENMKDMERFLGLSNIALEGIRSQRGKDRQVIASQLIPESSRERKRRSNRKRKGELPYSPNSRGWTRSKSGVRRFFQVPQVSTEAPALGPSSTAYAGILARSWRESRVVIIPTGIHPYACTAGSSFTCHATTPAGNWLCRIIH